MARKLGRRLSLAVLMMIASPLSPEIEIGSAQEPVPEPVAVAPAPEPARSHVVLVEAGQTVTAAQLEHSFVVVRRPDGRVPRAWLWDEPLGCPSSASR